MDMKEQLVKQLNAQAKEERLDALRQLKALLDAGKIGKPVTTKDTNNHVHTTYSFSAYSPTAAVYQAYMSGLSTVGIVDHDSISGAREFLEAGKILGITTTVGAEVRVSFAGTPMEGIRLNNPDETTIAYIALHGVPHNQIDALDKLLDKIRTLRNERNRQQVAKLNEILAPYCITLDFDTEVVPISMAAEGGSITERHILFALAKKLIDKYGKGQPLVEFLEKDLNIQITDSTRKMLLDTEFYAYEYDVLNVLKTDLVPKFFIAGGRDSLPMKEVVDYVRKLGIVPTYCYLGDVGASPTGDKKAQKFEDEYLDEILDVVKQNGFEAIAYMPSRNTMEQLKRVMGKCKEYGFVEISGEDINQPRQSFICEKLREPEFAHLEDSTWALVGHEIAAEKDIQECIYSDKIKKEFPNMQDRIAHFKQIAINAGKK